MMGCLYYRFGSLDVIVVRVLFLSAVSDARC